MEPQFTESISTLLNATEVKKDEDSIRSIQFHHEKITVIFMRVVSGEWRDQKPDWRRSRVELKVRRFRWQEYAACSRNLERKCRRETGRYC